MEPSMNSVVYYSFLEPNSSAIQILIRAMLQLLAIPVGEQHISALRVERYGDVWFLSVATGYHSLSVEWKRYPVSSTLTDGTSPVPFLLEAEQGFLKSFRKQS